MVLLYCAAGALFGASLQLLISLWWVRCHMMGLARIAVRLRKVQVTVLENTGWAPWVEPEMRTLGKLASQLGKGWP